VRKLFAKERLNEIKDLHEKANFMEEHTDWLIGQVETLIQIAETWLDIENGSTPLNVDDFYTAVQDILSDNGDF
jgi:hypothetical protein